MNELTELTEVHLKILSDITALQKNIMSSQFQIETLRITLKKIETTLLAKKGRRGEALTVVGLAEKVLAHFMWIGCRPVYF